MNGDSYHIYINSYKTHATDVTIQDEYQADINDFENIEPDHQVGLRDLIHEIEQL